MTVTLYKDACAFVHCYPYMNDLSLGGGISGYFYLLLSTYINFFTINMVILTKTLLILS